MKYIVVFLMAVLANLSAVAQTDSLQQAIMAEEYNDYVVHIAARKAIQLEAYLKFISQWEAYSSPQEAIEADRKCVL